MLRRMAAYVMGICMGGCLLWHFSNIVRVGRHYIQEPNALILWAEIILLAVFTIFILAILIEECRRELD